MAKNLCNFMEQNLNNTHSIEVPKLFLILFSGVPHTYVTRSQNPNVYEIRRLKIFDGSVESM